MLKIDIARKLGLQRIELGDTVKALGVLFNEHMTWNNQWDNQISLLTATEC